MGMGNELFRAIGGLGGGMVANEPEAEAPMTLGGALGSGLAAGLIGPIGSGGLREAFDREPMTMADAIKNSERTMATRLGRPRIPEEEKRKPVGVSLSPDIIAMLDEAARAAGESRSEVIEQLIGETAAKAGKIFDSFRAGIPLAPPLTQSERQTALELANQAMRSWGHPNPTIEVVSAALAAFYAAAVKAVRINR